jgi:AraC-like DNA-binding protein
LRISGSLLLRETYAPPWSIAIPASGQLTSLLGIAASVHVVAFHLVEFGHCTITGADGVEVLLTAGEMAICFGGTAHRISEGKTAKSQPVEELLAGCPNLRRPDLVDSPAGTSLLCGVFMLHHTPFNPLVAALPPLLRASLSRPGELHNLSGVARLMTDEMNRNALGGGYVVDRLLEVLCAEAVRAHIEAAPHREASWFRGIKDPVIGRAIAAIHAAPGADWTVQRLSSDVAMSPSRFAARFSEALGDSPMSYATKWRMNVACRELAGTQQGVEQIAARVGYESLAAFSRTFKKHVGISPAAWRTRERQTTT